MYIYFFLQKRGGKQNRNVLDFGRRIRRLPKLQGPVPVTADMPLAHRVIH